MKKHILSFTLAFLFILMLIPVAASAAVYGEVIPLKYDHANNFSNGLAAVKLNGKWGYIDKTGKEVIPITLEYDEVYPFSEGMASVWIGDKGGYIDKTGKEIVAPIYAHAWGFSNGLARVMREDGHTGYIDKTGKVVIPLRYENGKALSFSNGVAWAAIDNKWGLIDKTGKAVVDFNYDDVKEFSYYYGFSEGLSPYCLNGKWGIIDTNGNEVTPPIFDWINSVGFNGGVVSGKLDGKAVIIDKSGSYIIVSNNKEMYVQRYNTSVGLFSYQIGDYWGYMDKAGNVVIPNKYTGVGEFHDGLSISLLIMARKVSWIKMETRLYPRSILRLEISPTVWRQFGLAHLATVNLASSTKPVKRS